MIKNRLRFSIKWLKTVGLETFLHFGLRSGIFEGSLSTSLNIFDQDICERSLQVLPDHAIPHSGKNLVFEKCSRDPPKIAILALFVPFSKVFRHFLKNYSNDFFLTFCIDRSSSDILNEKKKIWGRHANFFSTWPFACHYATFWAFSEPLLLYFVHFSKRGA